MGNCISKWFCFRNGGEDTEEMCKAKTAKTFQLPADNNSSNTYDVVTATPRCRRDSRDDYYNSEAAEVFPRYNCGGVWKVNLVISSEQLSQILSEEARTEALIESVRTAAKCAASSGGSSVADAGSDQWSFFSAHNY